MDKIKMQENDVSRHVSLEEELTSYLTRIFHDSATANATKPISSST